MASSARTPADAKPEESAMTAFRQEIDTYEERWVAWQKAGAAHERAFRRKALVLAPIMAIAIAAGVALLVR
jgi:hypothetical protein